MFISEDGRVTFTKIVVVWGPPAAGKSTYIEQHAGKDDILVDIDRIKQAISVFPKTDAPPRVYRTSKLLLDTLLREVEMNRVEANTVWIATGRPNHEFFDPLGAEFVELIPSKEECIRRAMADPERKNKDLQKKIIEKWFFMHERG